MTVVVFVVGIPGAGKSTVAGSLASALGSPVLSIGERLRELSTGDSNLAASLSAGSLGPEAVVQGVVDGFIRAHSIAVVDGYPRHLKQALYLRSLEMRKLVVHLALDQGRAIERIQRRATRMDDVSLQARVARDAAALVDVLETLAASTLTIDALIPVPEVVSAVMHRLHSLIGAAIGSSTP
jgi:adenylate kinase family enzyme